MPYVVVRGEIDFTPHDTDAGLDQRALLKVDRNSLGDALTVRAFIPES